MKNTIEKEYYKNKFDDINFYYQNIQQGYKMNEKAKENLAQRCNYDYELLCSLKNYDTIGLVEYVADNQFDIDYDNLEIIKED